MTSQPNNGVPTPDAYVESLGERLAADGCTLTAGVWRDRRVLVGSRADRKARWFGTKVELFVLAAAVPEVDSASLADFTGWAMQRVSGMRSGLPGARNAVMVLPALVGADVQPSAGDWAAADARILGTSVVGRPVTVETPASGRARVTMYRGGVVWGGMFTRHVLEKASLYFP